MQSFLKVCYACLETSNNQLVDVCSLDNDNIPFMDKLRSCVSGDLEEESVKMLCLPCIEKLQNAYCFQQMVLLSQEALSKQKYLIGEQVIQNVFEPLTVLDQSTVRKDKTIELPEAEYKCIVYKTETPELSQESVDYDGYLTEETLETVHKLNQDLEYSCYHCNSVFNKRWKLQKHISSTHIQYKKFLCTYCNKSFKQVYHLREHLTSHTGEKNYICSFCCKSFQRLSSMHRHIRSHQRAPGEKTKRTPFLCTICGKSFPFSNGVQRHMRVHTGVRNHECHVCLRRFSQSTHLQVHMRTHTGEKPYICETCGMAYSLNATLLKHLKLHK